MKSFRFVLTALLLSLPAVALAQHEHPAAPAPAAPAEGQKSFTALKTLAGTWEGTLTTEPAVKEIDGKRVKVMIRETSRGNALMHEMAITGIPDDPITMLYLDGERVMLTHYCDAGNRPRMAGKSSSDGKRVAFEVLDVSGGTQRGHMADAAFTLVDGDRHLEEWKFNLPGGKQVKARFELQRTKDASGPFGQ